MEYTVVVSDDWRELNKFIAEVNRLIQEGWIPQGGISISDIRSVVYSQAMIRYIESN